MGVSKKSEFSDHQNEIADLAKALGHPARIAIIEHLLRQDSCICKDIVDVLPLSQPTISQHLKELKNAGVIQGSIEGNTVCYCLAPDTLAPLTRFGQIIQDKKLTDPNCC